MNKPYLLHAQWDADADIWIATSSDLTGLATEGAGLEALSERLQSWIPELLQAHDHLPADGAIAIEWLTRRFSQAASAAA